MRIIKGLLLLSFLTFVCEQSRAQDIHYTMFDMAPLSLNPANAGGYEGSFRLGGIYRTQWQGLSTNANSFSGFKTPSAYIDAPLRSPFNRKAETTQWIGLGAFFLNDNVGNGQLTNLNAALTLSYHILLGELRRTRLSIGARAGFAQQRVDVTQLRFEEGIVQGGLNGPYIPIADNALPDPSASFADFSAGVSLTNNGTKFGYQVGFAANHISQPTYNFLGSESRLPLGLIGSAIFNVGLNEKLLLRPMLFYQYMAAVHEVNAQVLLGVHMNEAKDVTVFFGGGYRLSDAAIGRIGLDIKGLRLGFAYDFNASNLSNNSRAQAFEIAASYVFRINRVISVDPVLFCPRF